MSTGNIVQGLWIGRNLSVMEQLSINSFLANKHEYHLYVYDEVSNVPDGAVVKDANELLPSSMIFQYRKHKTYAGFSNFFRYKLLLEKGGWWTDLDVICLKHFDFDEEYVFAKEHHHMGGEKVASCLIKAPRGAECLAYAWATCQSKDPKQLEWGETGPVLMQETVRKFALDQHVKSAVTFCPVPYARWYDILIPGRVLSFGEQTYAVHLWHEMWRRHEVHKDKAYHQECLYERLKRTYL